MADTSSTPDGQTSKFAPSVAFLQPQLGSLLKAANEVEQRFQEREAKLKGGFEQLEADKKSALEDIEKRKLIEQNRIELETQKMHLERENHQLIMAWERNAFKEEKRNYETMKANAERISQGQEPITLEVGGEKFRTEISTLLKHTNSLFPELARIAQGHTPPRKSKSDHIFIDRDGKHFRFILNYLRQGREVMRGTVLKNPDEHFFHELLCEIRYYKLDELERLVRLRQVAMGNPLDFSSLLVQKCFGSFKEPQKIPLAANPQQSITLKYSTTQDLLLKYKNFRGIKFENVFFKNNVSFEGSVLAKATFTQCYFKAVVNFKGSDLFEVVFDHCEGISPANNFVISDEDLESVTFNPPLQVANSP